MDLWLLALAALLVAVLYSSVGHGGASGYLAAMALAGMAPAQMKPTALVLNLLVSGLASLRYIREGCFKPTVFWVFAFASVPASFIGGSIGTSRDAYRTVLGSVLILAAVALLLPREEKVVRPLPISAGLAFGGAIGFVSGLIGVGGGIFLSPLLILTGWATIRETLGISALFIFVNSGAGLLGHVAGLQSLPASAGALAGAAFLGGLIGSEIGARKLAPYWIRWLLSAVLAIAATKLLLT
ncbi:MAG: sulfite exporter TauE/SafE family protein [Fimbriimonadaceae bacterium]